MLGRMLTEEALRRVVAGDVITPRDAEVILEVAAITAAVDGRLAPEEVVALRGLGDAARALAGVTGKTALSADDIDEIVGRNVDDGERAARETRLRTLAAELSGARARRLAYKVSVATALADSESRDEEIEMDLDLVGALGLNEVESTLLTADVHQNLSAP